jgi:uncharacterized membrane protein HdeD (DUF308 family)
VIKFISIYLIIIGFGIIAFSLSMNIMQPWLIADQITTTIPDLRGRTVEISKALNDPNGTRKSIIGIILGVSLIIPGIVLIIYTRSNQSLKGRM